MQLICYFLCLIVIVFVVFVVPLLSPLRHFVTPWTAVRCAALSFTISWSLLKLMSIELVMLSNHCILWHPLLSCLQSFPASGSFLMIWLFAWGSQSIGASASASGLAVNSQGWFPLGLTGLISLQDKGLSRVFFNTIVQKHQFFGTQPSLWPNSHIHTWLQENHSFDYMDLSWQSNIYAFSYAVLVCHSFLSKVHVSFNFMAAVTICSDFGAQENKSLLLFPLSPHLFAFKWWDHMPWS